MPISSAPPRSATASARVPATLVALAAVLVAAFVVAPPRLAAIASGGGFADSRQLLMAAGRLPSSGSC